ncbi:GIY-YIG nuclease family protein [Paenisporosarcina indica]|uniref:GIY-YIG nuclease family protein n=1 Tax=Paenisporosarcina indica TaxID=650093 RepID=UPI0009503597|nr:GIY-YIG nuclease family protein [Paenisporosarcina indica]
METTSTHVFYVLECSDGSYYAGYTNDLSKRVNVHNRGKGAKYTRARRPVRCIYQEKHETKQQAMKAEYAFKQLVKSKKIEYIAKETRGEDI